MKKLLSIIGAVGLTATASTAVISCGISYEDPLHSRFQEILAMDLKEVEALLSGINRRISTDPDLYNEYNTVSNLIVTDPEYQVLPENMSQRRFNHVHLLSLEIYLTRAILVIANETDFDMTELEWYKENLELRLGHKLVTKEHQLFAQNIIDYINKNEYKHEFTFENLIETNNTEELGKKLSDAKNWFKSNLKLSEDIWNSVSNAVMAIDDENEFKLPNNITENQFRVSFEWILIDTTITTKALSLGEKNLDLLKKTKEIIDNKLKKVSIAMQKHKNWIEKLSKFVDEQLA